MNKKLPTNLLGHPLTIAVFTALCFLAIISLRESSKSASVSKASLKQLEEKVELAKKEVEQAQKILEQGQDPLALEKIQRNELLQKKEGEIVLQIPELEKLSNQENQPKLKENGPLEEWQKLLFN